MKLRHSLPALAALAFALPVLTLPAFPQSIPAPGSPSTGPGRWGGTAAPKHDPRIPEILHSLEQVKNIRETQISPDGTLVAWTVDREGIFLAPLSNPAQVSHINACAKEGASTDKPSSGGRETGAPADRSSSVGRESGAPAGRSSGRENGLAWSPDSKTLAFFSDCTPDRKAAIFTDDVATASAAPRLFAQLNGFAKSLQYSPDGKFLSFLYVEGATRPSGALAAMKPPSGVIGVEDVEVQRVAAVDASSGNLTQITPANLHVYEFDWSNDSKNLTFVAAPPPGEDNWWTAKLYIKHVGRLYEAASSSIPEESLTREDPRIVFDPTTTTGPLHGLQIAVPRFSPDGSKIAFIGGLMSDQGVTGGDIYVMPSTGGDPKDVTPDRPSTPVWFTWLDEQQIGISEVQGPNSHLFVYNIETQQESPEHSLTLSDSVGAGELEMRVSTSNTNNIAFIRSSFQNPPEVWAGELNDMKQITHLNDGLKPSWGKSEAITWTNEGFHINGWLLYPAGYDPAKKYPMIVMVHGGPSSAAQPRWPR